jgi:hypothetical protein
VGTCLKSSSWAGAQAVNLPANAPLDAMLIEIPLVCQPMAQVVF